MVRVDGKDMIFATWFTMERDSTAIVDLPIEGLKMRFDIKEWTGNPNFTSSGPEVTVERSNWELEIDPEFAGSEVKVSMPFLILQTSVSRGFTISSASFNGVQCQVTRQHAAGTMLVHVALYHERTPNYGPR